MNKSLRWLLPILAIAFVLSSCKKEEEDDQISGDWAVPQEEVQDGGPGKDGIPSIDNPQFVSASEVDFIASDELVIGFRNGSEVRAYPHQILDWHEIVNDEVGGLPVAITYCPLTGTALAWDRNVAGATTTFGVSGLLFESNLVPYDRETDSNWSQILRKSINGSQIDQVIPTYQVFETTWSTWKEMYPSSLVLSRSTGVNRNYDQYPYDNYRTNSSLLFPVSHRDLRLHLKERVHGMVNGNAVRTYYFESFAADEVRVIESDFQGEPIVVAGHADKNFIVSFGRRLDDGTVLEFTPMSVADLPKLLRDQEGNTWDVFGRAQSGPRAGDQLTPTESFMGFWFSWAAFYPELELFESP